MTDDKLLALLAQEIADPGSTGCSEEFLMEELEAQQERWTDWENPLKGAHGRPGSGLRRNLQPRAAQQP